MIYLIEILLPRNGICIKIPSRNYIVQRCSVLSERLSAKARDSSSSLRGCKVHDSIGKLLDNVGKVFLNVSELFRLRIF